MSNTHLLLVQLLLLLLLSDLPRTDINPDAAPSSGGLVQGQVVSEVILRTVALFYTVYVDRIAAPCDVAIAFVRSCTGYGGQTSMSK